MSEFRADLGVDGNDGDGDANFDSFPSSLLHQMDGLSCSIEEKSEVRD